MASGVLRRTAYVCECKGYPIFHDYCMVDTTLGGMVEFQAPFQRGEVGGVAFNPAAESFKVDQIETLPLDKRPMVFWDEKTGLLLQENWVYKVGY